MNICSLEDLDICRFVDSKIWICRVEFDAPYSSAWIMPCRCLSWSNNLLSKLEQKSFIKILG